ncbi:hypothetical protein [Paractinoplanes atraurantiacus]|uniref:Uncharacterized protein n=1 Tax=Paractinoplanes atraurantiacus TaxID=1036182 RepID=A0A285J6W1_9ACTN|nr:hypothetical protein [Actinoplanes atraurantiacus]SNY56055.1 hypothetical protein SAMN05421748_11750 [Actinoplanes atraurantiacus]
MGVLTDYFRAPSAAAVQQELTMDEGGPLTTVYDTVEAKGIDPTVVLGQLIGFIRDEPWHPRIVDDRLIWPEGGEQDTSHEGPWTTILDNETRDTLASLDPARVPSLAARWFHHRRTPPEHRPALLRPAHH